MRKLTLALLGILVVAPLQGCLSWTQERGFRFYNMFEAEAEMRACSRRLRTCKEYYVKPLEAGIESPARPRYVRPPHKHVPAPYGPGIANVWEGRGGRTGYTIRFRY